MVGVQLCGINTRKEKRGHRDGKTGRKGGRKDGQRMKKEKGNKEGRKKEKEGGRKEGETQEPTSKAWLCLLNGFHRSDFRAAHQGGCRLWTSAAP